MPSMIRFALLLLLASTAQAGLLDRVVAVVAEEELILASDARLEAVLDAHDQPQVPAWGSREEDATQRLLDSAVVRHAAGDVALYRPGRAEVESRFDRIREVFRTREAWEAFLASATTDEDRLRLALERRLKAERYLQRTIPVDAEADPAAWRAACSAVVHRLASRVRLRKVKERIDE